MNKCTILRTLATFRGRYGAFENVAQHMDNFYDVLNVKVDSSDAEIRNAFISLTKKYHPDVGSMESGTQEFLKICDAYKTLSKKSLRCQYDKQLNAVRNLVIPIDASYTSPKMCANWERYQTQMRQRQCSGSRLHPIVMRVPYVKPQALAFPKLKQRVAEIKKQEAKIVSIIEPHRTRLCHRDKYNWMMMLYLAGFAVLSSLLGADCIRELRKASAKKKQNLLLVDKVK